MAVKRAKQKNLALSESLFDFIRGLLLDEGPPLPQAEDRVEQRRFSGKFQQVTAPVMAKGLEDTAFYVCNRLLSLNEVGGDPARFGLAPGVLHRYLQDRQQRCPLALSTTSTHDTKRSEDVRARLNVLSELPDAWSERLARWSAWNAVHRRELDGAAVPDANEEYHFYQTLLGAWPPAGGDAPPSAEFSARIQAYMRKALYEAKVHTSWVSPHPSYDEAVQEFIAAALDERQSSEFLADLRSFAAELTPLGFLNSLAQVVLKVAAPGVPDFYQGSELWDFSLVDPDNRRPVDYAVRRRLLGELQARLTRDQARAELLAELLANPTDGRIKLLVTHLALQARRQHAQLFAAGDYTPVEAAGSRADQVFSFTRQADGVWLLAAVPRLLTRLVQAPPQLPLGDAVWGDTTLSLTNAPQGLTWRNVFTDRRHAPAQTEQGCSLPAAELFAEFPVALLVAGTA
jgi:(1->4)-alpha-D-glucan 1-alpha-D-glucosylmutase